jgi:hypothetical protein
MWAFLFQQCPEISIAIQPDWGCKSHQQSWHPQIVISLVEARERRNEARRLLDNDQDPGAIKQAKKSANTVLSENSFEIIHDRMPVILPTEQWNTWLSPAENQADKLLTLICPHNSESMQAWPVSREFNKVGLRDDVGLTDKI